MTDVSVDSSARYSGFNIRQCFILIIQFVRLLGVLRFLPRLLVKAPADGFILFNNIEFLSKVEGKYVDKLLDPIADELAKRGQKKTIFEFSPTLSTQPFFAGRYSLTLILGLIKIISIPLAAVNALINKALYEDVLNFIKKNNLDKYITASSLNRLTAYIWCSSQLFRCLLSLCRPKVVLVGVYYGGTAMALVRACRSLGIDVYDIQHGIQGAGHRAYRPWSVSYDLIPTGFLCWDESSAQQLRSWVSDEARVITSGNGWYEYIAKKYPVSESAQAKSGSEMKRVLVTLQPLKVPLRPLLLEAVLSTPDDIFWEFRLHPTMSEKMSDDIRAVIDSLNCSRVSIQDPYEKPLPWVLFRTSLHITEFSSVAIEASLLGVPTIILDEQGVELFKDYVNTGLINYVCSVNELLSAITSSPMQIYMKQGDCQGIGGAIDQILNLCD